jgi:hypothetical protein
MGRLWKLGAYFRLNAPNAGAVVQKRCEAFGVADEVRNTRV